MTRSGPVTSLEPFFKRARGQSKSVCRRVLRPVCNRTVWCLRGPLHHLHRILLEGWSYQGSRQVTKLLRRGRLMVSPLPGNTGKRLCHLLRRNGRAQRVVGFTPGTARAHLENLCRINVVSVISLTDISTLLDSTYLLRKLPYHSRDRSTGRFDLMEGDNRISPCRLL